MRRYLLLANQTLGGSQLRHEIATRIEESMCAFHVVVPLTEPATEAVWLPADPTFGIPVPKSDPSEGLEEARRRSDHRLRRMISIIEELGAPATGEIGPPDPYDAVLEPLRHATYDEVIVSTLPVGLSRWVKMDLPSRLERATSLPVTVVEAEDTVGAR